MLYYPFIQPPRDVLAQGVLYWDRLGTIVPEHYVLPPQLERIRENGLYEPLEADRYVDEVSMDRLARQIEDLLSELPASGACQLFCVRNRSLRSISRC
jgi:hypothetical protein